jgi:transposase
MIPDAVEVRLSRKDREVLNARLCAPTTPQRDVFRARIILLAAEGRSTRSIARALKTMPRTVSLWRGRYAREGLAGLEERPRPGPKRKYGEDAGRRLLALLDQPPPRGYARWTGPLIAQALGDVHEQQVWRFLRAHKIDLAGRKSWCESHDPAFVAKAADIVGLYMAPPENAIVICVDEKPSIQALERAQGYLKLPNGRTLTGHSHDYKRNGTSTLFAALEVATGKVVAAHKKRRRRIEFRGFMNQIVAAYPKTKTAIHVILDNLNTHRPKIDRWLARHPNVRFHFTPTHASWLNQAEIWFSILEGKSLHGASFSSVEQLREHIDAFIAAYNEHAVPFVWTKAEVHQRHLKNRRISQL